MAAVINALKSRIVLVPFIAGANRGKGTMVSPGVTAETNLGVAIPSPTTTSSSTRYLGVTSQLFNYAQSGDALVAGATSWWPAPTTGLPQFAPAGSSTAPVVPVDIPDTATLVRLDYDLSTTPAAVASYSSPTVTITSLEDNIDTSWLYVQGGAGVGQLAFIITSTAGSCTITSALTTALTSSSKVVKILRLFHEAINFSAVSATLGTLMATTAAAGAGRGLVLESHMIQNGADTFIDPLVHHNAQNLNALTNLGFYAVVNLQDTAFHPIN